MPRQKTRLVAMGSTPGGKTRFFSWRQKPLDAACIGGECAACLAKHFYQHPHFRQIVAKY
jgi:hypothetical protein